GTSISFGQRQRQGQERQWRGSHLLTRLEKRTAVRHGFHRGRMRLWRKAKKRLTRSPVLPKLEVPGMSISLSCSCGRAMRVKEDCAGKRVRCPACKAILVVPAPTSQEQVQPEPGTTKPPQVPVRLGGSPPPRRPSPRKLPPWVVAAAAAGVLPLAGIVLAFCMP